MVPGESIAAVPANVVAQLRERLRRLETSARGGSGGRFSSGCPSLDQLLPEAGFPFGVLIEWLADGEGSGAETLALLGAREALAGGGALVVLDRRREFYPPTAAALGIDLRRTLVVRAARGEEELWALDQALRCPGVGAAWAAVEQLDRRWFRRLQLAVEQGGGVGMLLRPARIRGQPSWSRVQLRVQPRPSGGPRRLRVEITRCLGAAPGGSVELEIDDLTGDVRAAPAVGRGHRVDGRHETRVVSLVTQLAQPTSRRRAARA